MPTRIDWSATLYSGYELLGSLRSFAPPRLRVKTIFLHTPIWFMMRDSYCEEQVRGKTRAEGHDGRGV
jgi:hypothetical protein